MVEVTSNLKCVIDRDTSTEPHHYFLPLNIMSLVHHRTNKQSYDVHVSGNNSLVDVF